MRIFFGIIGILFGYAIIRYREPIGNALGDPAWAGKVGGIYNVLIIVGVFIFFWSLAVITNTTDILFWPLLMVFPNAGGR